MTQTPFGPIDTNILILSGLLALLLLLLTYGWIWEWRQRQKRRSSTTTTKQSVDHRPVAHRSGRRGEQSRRRKVSGRRAATR